LPSQPSTPEDAHPGVTLEDFHLDLILPGETRRYRGVRLKLYPIPTFPLQFPPKSQIRYWYNRGETFVHHDSKGLALLDTIVQPSLPFGTVPRRQVLT
jgi:hypothetical protein